jgi:alpha-mannosidase/mannosylglycerate hydrolase
LPEAELRPDGCLAITLSRSVGWLSRYGLATRAEPAGPATPTPGAQCTAPVRASLALLPASTDDPGERARAAELGLLAGYAGRGSSVPADVPLVAVEPASIVLSALKPADAGDGAVVRVLNPTEDAVPAELTLGLPVASVTSVRLDETPDGHGVDHEGSRVRLSVPARGWRSVRIA